MARNRGKNTKPEIALRRTLWARGLRYRLHTATSHAGRPDLVFAAHRVAVFIDGCFWHGCPLHYARPRTREEFWSSKLAANLNRDARQSTALADAGWRVIRIWEHEVVENVDEAAGRIETAISGRTDGWSDQQRVCRVLPLPNGLERREIVQLGAPTVIVGVSEGPRVTAKARGVRR